MPRGYELENKNGIDVWSDTQEPVDDNHTRACRLCNKMPTTEGHDACLANLPGVAFACCGHGVEEGYICFLDGRSVRFNTNQVTNWVQGTGIAFSTSEKEYWQILESKNKVIP